MRATNLHPLPLRRKTWPQIASLLCLLALSSCFSSPSTPNSPAYVYFPRSLPNGEPVQPHSNQLLKILLEKHFAGKFHPQVSFKQLQISAQKLFRPNVKKLKNDFAWSLQAFSQMGKKRWKNLYGEEVHLDKLAQVALQWLEQLTQPVKMAQRQRKLYPKSEIHRWYCGGFHLFQGVLAAWKYGTLPAKKKRLETIVHAFFYRLQNEEKLYRYLLQQHYTKKSSGYFLSLYLALLKFYGHCLESLFWAKEWAIWNPTQNELQQIQTAKQKLTQVVEMFWKQKVYPNLEWWCQNKGKRFYRDLLNDSCHALQALRLWEKKTSNTTKKLQDFLQKHAQKEKDPTVLIHLISTLGPEFPYGESTLIESFSQKYLRFFHPKK
ncbi:MAG: hypothetical protein D6805_03475 [Planctomycetota bacterium]|nr:MAG: hypothetical protein D6805_03475 [Planctomycetota bacterium]